MSTPFHTSSAHPSKFLGVDFRGSIPSSSQLHLLERELEEQVQILATYRQYTRTVERVRVVYGGEEVLCSGCWICCPISGMVLQRA